MKAAVFAALATTAAAFALAARPLAAAAATKLSVVPETVAELLSMLTALTLCGDQPVIGLGSIDRKRLTLSVHTGAADALDSPQEGELFFTSPFFVAFFVLSSAFGWPVSAAPASNSP